MYGNDVKSDFCCGIYY